MSTDEFFKENTFTPCFDVLSTNYPHHVDRVYGKIWRYCQMKNGNCFASEIRMAKELNIAKNTLRKCIAILEKAGYIIDTTPELDGDTHKYIIIPERLEEELRKGHSTKEQGVVQGVNKGSAASEQVVVQPMQGGCAANANKDTNNIPSEETNQERKEDMIPTFEGSSEPSNVRPASSSPINKNESTSLEGIPSTESLDRIPDRIEANLILGVQPMHNLPINKPESELQADYLNIYSLQEFPDEDCKKRFHDLEQRDPILVEGNKLVINAFANNIQTAIFWLEDQEANFIKAKKNTNGIFNSQTIVPKL